METQFQNLIYIFIVFIFYYLFYYITIRVHLRMLGHGQITRRTEIINIFHQRLNAECTKLYWIGYNINWSSTRVISTISVILLY